jgi:hypothetical protein
MGRGMKKGGGRKDGANKRFGRRRGVGMKNVRMKEGGGGGG